MNIVIIGLIGLLVGAGGFGLGGIIGIFVKRYNWLLSILYGLTSGFLLFIATFHLIPESFILAHIKIPLLGVATGILLIIILEYFMKNTILRPNLRASLILSLSIGIHCFPEGLALGSSLIYSPEFAKVLILAMLIHNIPEGISLSLPLSLDNLPPMKIIFYTMLVGIPTAIGAFLGAYLGYLSNNIISFSLALAGGTMLYVICNEFIPTGKTLHKGRVSSVSIIVGFLIAMVIYF